MKFKFYLLIIISTTLYSCSSNDDNGNTSGGNPNNELYFPPINSNEWEIVEPADLGWNTSNLNDLRPYLENLGTKAFIIVYNGRLVVEWYMNNADANSNLTWNSAAKTLSAYTIGIAQEEGYLNINSPSKLYLGEHWSSLSTSEEEAITIRHHLTMTTGLDFTVINNACTDPYCLNYLNTPGSFWYYHNAPYTLTHDIIVGAINDDFNTYFNTKLRNKIGMQGNWVKLGYFKLYFSNARSMARFGLLNLNKGKWQTETILNDPDYFEEMTNTSQDLNLAYGYLWWLNGKSSFRIPGSTDQYPGKLIPNAPNDLIAALGKDDQKLYVIPSKKLVIVRMGDDASTGEFGPTYFDNDLWGKLNNILN